MSQSKRKDGHGAPTIDRRAFLHFGALASATAVANDGTDHPLRTAIDKIDENFNEANAACRVNAQTPGVNWYNVKSYGAKGDGVTDDRAAIQAAIDDAAAKGGGVVFFPPGTYLVSWARDWDTGGMGLGVIPLGLELKSAVAPIILQGSGRRVSVLKRSTAGGRSTEFALLVNSNYSYAGIVVRDLGFNGNYPALGTTFYHLIYLLRCEFTTIDGCEFISAGGGGLYIWQNLTPWVTHCHFESIGLGTGNVYNACSFVDARDLVEPFRGAGGIAQCSFKNYGQVGISLATRNRFKDTIIDATTHYNDMTQPGVVQPLALELVASDRVSVKGLHVYGGSGVAINGTRIVVADATFVNMNRGSGRGNAFTFNNPIGTSDVKLENIVIDTTTDEGLLIGGKRNGAGHLTFVNVHVLNAGKQGFKEVGGPQALEGATFIGCTAYGCQREGFLIDSQDVNFIGCRAAGNGAAASNTIDGLFIQNAGDRCVVIGGQYGYANETVQRYGINNAGLDARIIGPTLFGATVGLFNTHNPGLFVGEHGSNQTQQTNPLVVLTDATTILVDASRGNIFHITLTASGHTIGAPTNPLPGQRITFIVVQDRAGLRTLFWNPIFKVAWSNVGNLSNKRSSVSFVYDGTNWNQDGAQSPYI